MFNDPDGLCREVGALLTWIDCGDPDCPTSSLNDPERYTGGYNNPKYVDNQRYYEEQAKLLKPILIPIPEPVEVALGGFVVGFVPGALGGMPGAVGSGGASVLIAGVGAGLLGAIGALINYLIFG